MTFKVGDKRPEKAGRKKGTPNKATQTLQEIADSLGIDPFKILLYFAKGDWEALGYESPEIQKCSMGNTYYEPVIPPELRQKSAKDACEYLYPKRKAIELRQESSGKIQFISKDELNEVKRD